MACWTSAAIASAEGSARNTFAASGMREKNVDHDSEFEREDPEETGDLGQINHPDVIRPPSLYAPLRQHWFWIGDAPLPPDAANGTGRDSPACSGQCVGDGVVASE